MTQPVLKTFRLQSLMFSIVYISSDQLQHVLCQYKVNRLYLYGGFLVFKATENAFRSLLIGTLTHSYTAAAHPAGVIWVQYPSQEYVDMWTRGAGDQTTVFLFSNDPLYLVSHSCPNKIYIIQNRQMYSKRDGQRKTQDMALICSPPFQENFKALKSMHGISFVLF